MSVIFLNLTVLDANSLAVTDAHVTWDGKRVALDLNGSGRLRVKTNANSEHKMVVGSRTYVTETVTFQEIVQGEYNNPLVSRIVSEHNGQTEVSITVYLGRLNAVDILETTYAKILLHSGAKTDPRGAFLGHIDDDQNKPLAFYRQRLGKAKIWLTENHLLPEGPEAASYLKNQGWERFTGRPCEPAADVFKNGRFYFLSNTRQPTRGRDHQACVAVWSPYINSDLPLGALDMVVLFTPTTGGGKPPFKVRYPFGVSTMKNDPTHPVLDQRSLTQQWYISLASRFLYDYGPAYEIVARNRRAAIVIPIAPHGNRAPYDTGEGLLRLCREVCVFLHRDARTSSLGGQYPENQGPDDPGVPAKWWHCGVTLRSKKAKPFFRARFGPPPRVGRVAVAGFSDGMEPVRRLMKTWPLPPAPKVPPFDQRFWGCPMTTQSEWDACWLELWDLDGAHNRLPGGWPEYLRLLGEWAFPADEEPTKARMVRMCHTAYTTGNIRNHDPLLEKHPTWTQLLDESKTIPVENKPWGDQARELSKSGANGRWSVVYVADEAIDLQSDPQFGEPPLTIDAHHAMAKIAINYSMAHSFVGLLNR